MRLSNLTKSVAWLIVGLGSFSTLYVVGPMFGWPGGWIMDHANNVGVYTFGVLVAMACFLTCVFFVLGFSIYCFHNTEMHFTAAFPKDGVISIDCEVN